MDLLGVTDTDGVTEVLTVILGVTEIDGVTLILGVTEAVTDIDGVTDTDGVTEGYIDNDKEFTIKGIEKEILGRQSFDIKEIIDVITDKLNNRENLRDDITMMGIQ